MTGGDYSLADLAADADLDTDGDGSSSGDDGGMLDALQFLDDRGYLQQLLAASDLGGQQGGGAADGPLDAAQARAQVEGEVPAASTDGGEQAAVASLDAENIAQFGKLVIDEFGDVPVSKVVKIAEANPQQVNQAIQQQIGDGGDA